MKLTRMALALVALVLVAGLAYVAQQTDASAPDMVAAAQKFLETLSDEQKAKTVFAFDSPERINWHFVPLEKAGQPTRKGMRLEEMSDTQKKAALALLQSGTSKQGDVAALTIMSLEAILKDDQEKRKQATPIRNPQWYFFTIFGTPSKTGSWGWRVEGHHLSLNLTLQGAEVVSTTPNFYGANPAEIRSGPKKGVRVLDPTEQLAFELFKSMDAEQKKVVHQEEGFKEPQAQTAKPNLGAPVGLPAAKMTAGQKETLTKLLKSYTDRMRPDISALEFKLATAKLEQVHFAFSGKAEDGQKHTYRVQGPTIVIEFLNEQPDGAGNSANHIHSSWRHIEGDFGKKKS
jgi:hypothetical protein